MSNSMEQYIRDHRDEFDGEEPSQKVWENIKKQMDPAQKPAFRGVFTFKAFRWSAAAAILLMAATGYWFFTHDGRNKAQMAVNTAARSSSQTPSQPLIADSHPKPEASKPVNQNEQAPTGSSSATMNNSADNDINEEMYHYAKLVEIKHRELKQIEKDEPLLYKKFASDVYHLDSVYHSLDQQLGKNPNREQLLEAMIQNLQLQMQLLNHQLNIVKQINHSKKSEYENAYKSI